MKSPWSTIALLLPESSSSEPLFRDWGFVLLGPPCVSYSCSADCDSEAGEGVIALLSSYQLVCRWPFCAVNAFQWMLRDLCTGLTLRWNQLVNFQLFRKRWKNLPERPLPATPNLSTGLSTHAIKIQKTLSKSVTWIFKGRWMGFHFHDISVQEVMEFQ